MEFPNPVQKHVNLNDIGLIGEGNRIIMQSEDYDQAHSAMLLHYTTKYLQFLNQKTLRYDLTFRTLDLNQTDKIRSDEEHDDVVLDYSLNSKYQNHGYSGQCQFPKSEDYSNQCTQEVSHLKRATSVDQDLCMGVKLKIPKVRSYRSDEISQSDSRSPIEDSLRSPISGMKILPVSYLPADASSEAALKLGSLPRTEQMTETSDQDTLNRLRKVPNLLGDYICQLCLQWFPDAISLARHLCPRMASLAYPCEMCEKVFNCPANLASHRRWHRPELNHNRRQSKSKRLDPQLCAQNANHPFPTLTIENFSSLYQSELTSKTSTLSQESDRTDYSLPLGRPVGLSEKMGSQSQMESRPNSPLNTKECLNTVFRTSKYYKPGKNQVQIYRNSVKPSPVNAFSVEALLS